MSEAKEEGPGAGITLVGKLVQANYLEIAVNRIKCNLCDDILTSTHRHDFVTCKCGAVAVDGGLEYGKRCGDRDSWTEMSLYKPIDKDLVLECMREIENRARMSIGLTHGEALALAELTETLLNTSLKYYATVDYNFESGKIPPL